MAHSGQSKHIIVSNTLSPDQLIAIKEATPAQNMCDAWDVRTEQPYQFCKQKHMNNATQAADMFQQPHKILQKYQRSTTSLRTYKKSKTKSVCERTIIFRIHQTFSFTLATSKIISTHGLSMPIETSCQKRTTKWKLALASNVLTQHAQGILSYMTQPGSRLGYVPLMAIAIANAIANGIKMHHASPLHF